MAITKHAKVTGDERRAIAETLAEKYRAGATLRALAKETGRSHGWVRSLLIEAGVSIRAHGTRYRPEA